MTLFIMNNQSGMSNQNELDLTDLKYQMEVIERLSSEIYDSVLTILPSDINEISHHAKQAKQLEKISNIYPAMEKLIIDLQDQIDALPEFIEVSDDLYN